MSTPKRSTHSAARIARETRELKRAAAAIPTVRPAVKPAAPKPPKKAK